MNKVKVGLIGCGWWATLNHLPILARRKDVEIVSVCGLDELVLAKIQTSFGVPHSTTDYRTLLQQDLDAVIVASPHRFHFEHAKASFQARLHVMCEKPMTLHAREAWELVNLARANNRILLVPYGWHYLPFIQEAKKWADAGLLGEIEYVLCHMASPTKELFSGSGVLPSMFTSSIATADPTTWQVRSLGGGYGHGQITHSAALMFWLTGLDAREVTCQMSSLQSDVDMYDAALVRCTNDALVVLSGAATLPANNKFQLDLRIFGKKGVLLLDVERERLELRLHDGSNRLEKIAAGAGAYSCDAPPNVFVDLVLGHNCNHSSGEIAAKSVEIVDAMYKSAKLGCPVPIVRQ